MRTGGIGAVDFFRLRDGLLVVVSFSTYLTIFVDDGTRLIAEEPNNQKPSQTINELKHAD
jgi:hypothetical protein